MAFTIKIFEQDRYLFSLLKTRLELMFPDAYIVDAIANPEQSGCVDFSEFTRIIYDPRNIDMSDFKDAVPLCDASGIIDCRLIAENLGIDHVLRGLRIPDCKNKSKTVALIPYVYMKDREAMISRMISNNMFTSDYSLRLDFMGRMRVPGPDMNGIRPGGMTKLLEQAAKKSFKSEDIFAYCNMDKNGFMTPGATSGEDDVYDAGPVIIKKIIDASLRLAAGKSPATSVLCIFEGFRTNELTELVSPFDEVNLLLPSRTGQENLGTKKLASGIERSLASGHLNICYAEDLPSLSEVESYEQAL